MNKERYKRELQKSIVNNTRLIEDIESGEVLRRALRTINDIHSIRQNRDLALKNLEEYYKENNETPTPLISYELQKKVQNVIDRFSDQWFYDDADYNKMDQPFYTDEGNLDWYEISEHFKEEDIIKMFQFKVEDNVV
jgi:hypothetical protein